MLESAGSSLSMEPSLKTESAKSPSNSAGSLLFRMHAGWGSGRNKEGLETFSCFGFTDTLIPDSVRVTLAG